MKKSVSAIAGSVSLVGAAILAVVQSLPVTRWIGVGVLVLVACFIAMKEIASHRENRRDAESKRDSALRRSPTAVKDTDPFSIGVTPSSIADHYKGDAALPPYVPRDIDPKIDLLLRQHPFVAVVGPSKAGKSRTAFEAILRNYPERALIAPELPSYQREGLAASLEGLITSGSRQGVVIWLDDLQEFLRTHSIATQDLNAWRKAHPRVIVVATIRDSELAGLRKPNDSGADIEKIIERAAIIPLPPLLSDGEQIAAKAAYPDEDFRDGIGVHFVAGPQLVERFVSAREANPVGFAVAAASVDRRRAGLYDVATEAELETLAPVYYKEILPRSVFPKDDLRIALDWAMDPVIQDIGIILKRGEGYEPFEYITAFRDGEVAGGVGAADIPVDTWYRLIEEHSGWALRSIGHSAASRERFDIACLAFEKLSKDDDPHVAVHGIDDLGAALRAHGDQSGALEKSRIAAASGYDCVVASASYRLALALDVTNDNEREALYRTVLEYPNSWCYYKAAVNLGLLLRSKTSVESTQTKAGVQFIASTEERNDRDRALEDEAQALFELAVESDDGEAIGNGANALGALFCARGDLEEGERALRKGIEAGSIQAVITLALSIYELEGREVDAWKLIDLADGMEPGSNSDYLNMAAGIIAEARGDNDEAIARYRLVLTDEAEGLKDEAAARLSSLLEKSKGGLDSS